MNEVIEELVPPLKLISLILYCGMKCYVLFSPSSPIIHLINSTLIPFVFECSNSFTFQLAEPTINQSEEAAMEQLMRLRNGMLTLQEARERITHK